MDLRFTPGGAYLSDIQKLRDRARSNATPQNVLPIRLQHPDAPNAQLDVYVNFAFQSNKSMDKATASIYLVAIGNAVNTWHFANVPTPDHSMPFPGNMGLGGEYGTLGYTGVLPQITNSSLSSSVLTLSGYNGGVTTAEVRKALAILIIAVSEATRFSEVAQKVHGALGLSGKAYSPSWALVHDWGGAFLAS